MTQELGKIEKPLAKDYRKGRRLYFVPLIYAGRESSVEYLEKFNKYWKEADEQINDLELKLGNVNRIYHELIPASGEEGLKALKELNENSHRLAQSRFQKGSQFEAVENAEILTEFMDWNRCLAIGLQNQAVLSKVYDAYNEVGKKRNDFIARKIDETLKEQEIGILFMSEGHQIQFPSDIEIFYVAPPVLDEINRWLRDLRTHPVKKQRGKKAKSRRK